MQFSHLHTHTQFSLLDGAASIERLYDKAYADGMPALAITDHGNMFGVFDFVAEAWKRKKENENNYVKPIVGCEFYMVEDRHVKTFSREVKDKRYHQLLLAKNEIGYRNLTKLCSLGYTEGLYGKFPRIDKQLLEQYNEGLIATTCCIGAEIPQAILHESEEAAEEKLKWWIDMFGEDFYIEIQRHGMPEEEQVLQTLLKFADKYKLEVIATNDSHYVEREDSVAHDILLCVNTGRKLHEPILKDFVPDESINRKDYRFGFFNDEFFFKTQQEMEKTFSDVPHAVANTQQIVDKIEMLQLEKDVLLPNFPIPPEFGSQIEYLRHLTWEGAQRRYGEITAEVEERINYELSVIEKMGFAGYFLIVSDFIKAGKDMGVYIGPGRGSAAGSAVAYCIEITNIDPIKYNLLFERFLNENRKSMPDIDTDFEDDGRQKVIDYVVDKYKQECVAHIATFGTMKARSSIKDVARVMDVPLAQSNALASLVPATAKDLNQVLDPDIDMSKHPQWNGTEIKQFQSYHNTNTPEGKILEQALKLEGSVRNSGVHAAGIIIAPEDISNLIPVFSTSSTSLNITQFHGDIIERSGVIKMDFLGLRTLSILKDAASIVEKVHGTKIVLDDIPLDDPETYKIYQAADTHGIFQFESPGMQTYLKQLKPDCLEDIIAMNALYRPGPMEYIPQFIRRKHGKEEVSYDLEGTEKYLQETFGITVYQEQVMLLAQSVGGFTPVEADALRKVMGKKKPEILDPLKSKFIEGGIKNGHPKASLEKVWSDWENFAKYAFNKSHSTCYAVVSFQSAYFKAHYPAAFMAAQLNHSNSLDKISEHLGQCKKKEIAVLGPDINESIEKFFVNAKGEIRFGLGSIKGVNTSNIKAIIEERDANGPFKNIFDLVERVPPDMLQKKTLENLAAVGAFDNLDEYTRSQYVGDEEKGIQGGVEALNNYAKAKAGDIGGNTMTLFGAAADIDLDKPKMPTISPWPEKTRLQKEKELVGLFFSGHPLDKYELVYKHLPIATVQEMLDKAQELEEYWAVQREEKNMDDRHFTQQLKKVKVPIKLLVNLESKRVGESKNGKPYSILFFSDKTAESSSALFGQTYYDYDKYALADRAMLLEGYIDSDYRSLGGFRFTTTRVTPAEEILETGCKKLEIDIENKNLAEDLLHQVVPRISTTAGKGVEIRFNIISDQEKEPLSLVTSRTHIMMDNELLEALDQNIYIRFKIY